MKNEQQNNLLQRVSFSEANNVIKIPMQCEVTKNNETPKFNEIVSETEVCPTCDDKGWIICDDGKNLCPDCGCCLG